MKRLSGDLFDEIRTVLRTFVHEVVKDATIYMEYARRKTVTAMDVVYALKHRGRMTLYGYDTFPVVRQTSGNAHFLTARRRHRPRPVEQAPVAAAAADPTADAGPQEEEEEEPL